MVRSKATTPTRSPISSATGIDEADDLAILLDPPLVAHRRSSTGSGAPVHLSDVVVRLVVANSLEIGAETQRTAAAPPFLGKTALAHGHRQPARRREIGIDDQLVTGPGPVIPGAKPERALVFGRGRFEPVAPAPHNCDRRPQRIWILLRLDPHVGRGRLAHRQPTSRTAVCCHRHLRRHAPREAAWHSSFQIGQVAGRPGIGDYCRHDR